MNNQVECTDCGHKYDYTENIIGDYTECVGTMLDGCLLSGCPKCGEEETHPQ